MARLWGTRYWVRTIMNRATISPNTTTGRAMRKLENPVACITTNSLSDINRFVPYTVAAKAATGSTSLMTLGRVSAEISKNTSADCPSPINWSNRPSARFTQ